MGGGIVTVVSVHPARWCTSPRAVVPVGLGDDVGDCHDAANLPKERLFISPLYLFGRESHALFFQGMFFYCWILLDLQVAERVHSMLPRCLVGGVSLGGHFWGKAGISTVRPRFLPCLGVFFWLANGLHFLERGW